MHTVTFTINVSGSEGRRQSEPEAAGRTDKKAKEASKQQEEEDDDDEEPRHSGSLRLAPDGARCAGL